MAGPGGPQVNDVLFVSDLLTHLQSVLCIDPLRIYATGFSNGAGMTNVLACTLAGRLAAFAPVSGSYPPYPGGCHPVRPVPLLELHGTADPIVPYNGSARKQLPPLLAWLQGWATRDGCTRGPTVFYKQANVTGLEWTVCQGNATVIQYRISGEGHVWPHVSFNKPGGTAVSSLSASALIWSFSSSILYLLLLRPAERGALLTRRMQFVADRNKSTWHISVACRLVLLQKEVL